MDAGVEVMRRREEGEGEGVVMDGRPWEGEEEAQEEVAWNAVWTAVG